MAIVFAAMAVDCQLSRLHHKWEKIAGYKRLETIPNEVLDERLRSYRTIRLKIEKVSRMLCPTGIDAFVEAHDTLGPIVRDRFPNLDLGNLAESLQRELFWPRNRILHLGDSSFQRADANRIVSISTVAVAILNELDRYKRDQQDQSSA